MKYRDAVRVAKLAVAMHARNKENEVMGWCIPAAKELGLNVSAGDPERFRKGIVETYDRMLGEFSEKEQAEREKKLLRKRYGHAEPESIHDYWVGGEHEST